MHFDLSRNKSACLTPARWAGCFALCCCATTNSPFIIDFVQKRHSTKHCFTLTTHPNPHQSITFSSTAIRRHTKLVNPQTKFLFSPIKALATLVLGIRFSKHIASQLLEGCQLEGSQYHDPYIKEEHQAQFN